MESELKIGWAEVPLDELCNMVYGKGLLTKNLTDEGFPVYGANGIIGKYSKYIYEKPQVIISCRGAASGVIHKTVPKSFVTSNSIVLGLKSEEINLDFFKYAMLSVDRTKIVTGSAQPQITIENLNDLQIPLAPLPEQHRIVAKLDELMEKTERSKKRLEKIPLILKRFRQSVLAAAVSGKLTEEWREKNKITSVTESKEFDKKHFKGNDDLPDEWSWMLVEDYIVNCDKGRIPVSQEERKNKKGKFPYYGATGVIDNIDGFTHDGEFILLSEDGMNLLYRTKPQAYIARGKIWVNNHAHVLKSKNGFENMYAVYCFNTIDLSQYLSGIDQVKLTQKNLNSIPLPIPPKEEQHEIVRRVEALFAFANKIETRYTKAKTQFDKLPQALLAKAFKGELVEQDERDESAGVLLERIRKGKEKMIKNKKAKEAVA